MIEALAPVKSALYSIWRQRWWALGLAILLGILGSMHVMRMPARYEASARVYIDTQSILQPLLSGLTVQPNLDQQVAIMGRTLLSRPNVERILRMSDIDLTSRSTAEREQAIDSLSREIRMQAAPGSMANLFTISYSSDRPETARKVVQSLLSLALESNLGEKRRDSEQARKFIDEQISNYEQELSAAENKLKEFKIRNMALMPALAGDYLARSTEIQQRVTQARLDLREAETVRDELRKQLAGETPSFALAPEPSPGDTRASGVSSTSELDVRIESLQKSLDSMLSRYTDNHPDVVGTRRILQQLEQQRDTERRAAAAARTRASAATPGTAPQQRLSDNPVYQQLKLSLADAEGQVASLRARVAGLEGQLAQARASAQAVPRVEAEFTQLNRDYEVHKRNYDQLVQRRESAKLSGNLEGQAGVAEFRIVDPPRVGSQPVSPNRPVLLAGVLLGSLAAGIGFAFLKDQIKPVYHDLRSLRAGTDMPMLGVVSAVLDARTRMRHRIGALAFSGTALLYIGLFAGIVLYQLSRAKLL